jgi:hypothetical protein
MNFDNLSNQVIGLAIEVHRNLGQGCWSRFMSNVCLMNYS